MNDRATLLARTLLIRLQALEVALLDDAAPSEVEEAARREELVGRVLQAVGIADPSVAAQLALILPAVRPDVEPSDRDVKELADSLDGLLPPQV